MATEGVVVELNWKEHIRWVSKGDEHYPFPIGLIRTNIENASLDSEAWNKYATHNSAYARQKAAGDLEPVDA